MAQGEIDPLMPQNEPSPEISNYGTTKLKNSSEIYYSSAPPNYQGDNNYDNDNDNSYAVADEAATPDQQIRQSIWGTIISIGSFLLLFGLVVAALYPHAPSWDGRNPVGKRPQPNLTIRQRTDKILDETPMFDGHNDLAFFIRTAYQNNITSLSFRDRFEGGGMDLNVDLPRLRTGKAGGAFWSAFVVCPQNASNDFSDEQYATAVSHSLQQIDVLKRLQAQYPAEFTPAGTNLDKMLSQFHATKAMLGPISIEGLHQVPQSAAMSTLRLYYGLGVRAATLTWNCHNAFADAALTGSYGKNVASGRHRGGLTTEGRKVVREMNRMGMLVDISHTSYWTQVAVLSNNTSRAPVIFSHSSAFTICPHPRNVKDDVLDLVKQTDSLVMVNFSPAFISCTGPFESGIPTFYEQNNTLHQVARHVKYIGDRIGYRYVGLGSDFDGMGKTTPAGLEGVDKFPALVAELLGMGISDADASKVVGGNLIRVWKRAEEVATQMQLQGVAPGEDEVHGY